MWHCFLCEYNPHQFCTCKYNPPQRTHTHAHTDTHTHTQRLVGTLLPGQEELPLEKSDLCQHRRLFSTLFHSGLNRHLHAEAIYSGAIAGAEEVHAHATIKMIQALILLLSFVYRSEKTAPGNSEKETGKPNCSAATDVPSEFLSLKQWLLSSSQAT